MTQTLPVTKQIAFTGDRPTGPRHLEDFIGWLSELVHVQHEYQQLIMIADLQVITENILDPTKIQQNIVEMGLDYLAVGIDPEVTTLLIQSLVPELAELSAYYMNFVAHDRLLRYHRVKRRIKQLSGVPTSFVYYPISQAAEITAFKANLVPVWSGHLPMVEFVREVVRKFNRTYECNVLVEPKQLLLQSAKLPRIDGSSNMGNTIALKDDADTVRQKVRSMLTDPNHLRIEDPGTVVGNPVFAYLDIVDPDREGLQALKEHYQRGGLADSVVKRRLTEVLLAVLDPIRARREEFAKDPAEVMRILKEGSIVARSIAARTLAEIRHAMCIDYFAPAGVVELSGAMVRTLTESALVFPEEPQSAFGPKRQL